MFPLASLTIRYAERRVSLAYADHQLPLSPALEFGFLGQGQLRDRAFSYSDEPFYFCAHRTAGDSL